MKRTSLGNGLYRGADGAFWMRPTIAGRRTWKRLASMTVAEATVEAASLVSDHARSKRGLCSDPFKRQVPVFFRDAYAESGRKDPQAERLLGWWGGLRVDEITMEVADQWANMRRSFPRACDIELSIISSVLKRALGKSPFAGRARCKRSEDVRHSREVAPASGDELHALARALLARPASQGAGWQLLFQAMTGLRTQELLALRIDAAPKGTGWIEGRFLYVRRAKGGMFPYVEIHPALAECIAAHRRWLTERYPNSPYWFPGADGVRPLNRVALTHALERLGGPKRTAHGMRAYCVTVHRSMGESDRQVAARIGDKTESLIATTYGNLPEVWAGGEPLSWMPKEGAPAWEPWCPPPNVIQFRDETEAASAIS